MTKSPNDTFLRAYPHHYAMHDCNSLECNLMKLLQTNWVNTCFFLRYFFCLNPHVLEFLNIFRSYVRLETYWSHFSSQDGHPEFEYRWILRSSEMRKLETTCSDTCSNVCGMVGKVQDIAWASWQLHDDNIMRHRTVFLWNSWTCREVTWIRSHLRSPTQILFKAKKS